VRDISLDLFQRAASQEARGAACERNLPGAGQAGTHPDEILFGDADINQAIGKAPLELFQVRRAHRIVDHSDDATVLLGERDQGLGECDAAISAFHSSPSSSTSAAASSSSVGTRWCHSTRSSMNETPRPLFVLAMTHVGRPAQAGRVSNTLMSAPISCPSTSTTLQP